MSPTRSNPRSSRRTIPLAAQIGLAVAVGCLLGRYFEERPFVEGTRLGNASLGELAVLLTTLLKTIAGPLIFFAVLDAFLRTEITWERGRKLVKFSLINVLVAMTVGLTVMNLLRPGESWSEQFAGLEVAPPPAATERAGESDLANALFDSLKRTVPTSVVQPFADGNLMAIILLAALIGAAIRALRNQSSSQAGDSDDAPALHTVELAVAASYRVMLRVLEWVVRLVPLAVLAAVADSVGKSGWKTFQLVGVFFGAILIGLTLHAFGYYTLVAWWYGGKPPRLYLGRGARAMLTGFSTNSSLATVPETLRALTDGMGVSDQSARLAACVGTNFNNDGITLYEAMTALFLAQAVGGDTSLSGQIQTLLICVLVSLGAGGIPQGGLAVLPLVLLSTGLSSAVVNKALPLIMTIDWILARYRSCVNVMGDMVVAIQLDRSRRRELGTMDKESL